MKIIGTPLYQWEDGRQLQVTPLWNMRVDCVHIANVDATEALVVKPKEKDGILVVDIPNILLQSGSNIIAYSVNVSEDCVETLEECVFSVRARPKPADYVYTETEVLNYTYLDKRLDHLEGDGLANAVEEYLKENPVQAGATAEEAEQIAQNKADIEKLSTEKLDATELPTAINEALAEAKASGQFDGADGKDAIDGKDGEDGYSVFYTSKNFQPNATVTLSESLVETYGRTLRVGDMILSPNNAFWQITAVNSGTLTLERKFYTRGDKGDPGKDYVLTSADKTEIAEMAAELVDVPEGSGAVSGTLLPETEISQQGRVRGFGYESTPVGAKVVVIMDGKPYITTHRVDGEGANALDWIGNIALLSPDGAGTEYDTGDPFFALMYSGFSDFFFADGASHKVAICTVDVLDEVYVNALNSIGNMSGGSGNFVVELTTTDGENFTANKTYEEIVTAWGDGLCVLAMMAGEPITVPLTGIDIDKGDLFFEMSAGIFEGAEMTAVLTCSPGNEWSLIQKAIPTMETVERLAGELMTGVAKVPTASVGQTIKVKSVDDNGVPTAWEAEDIPTDEHINGLIDTKLEDLPSGGGGITDEEYAALVALLEEE